MKCLTVFIGKVHWPLGCEYILLTFLFLYCALRGHVRRKHLINTLSHYKYSFTLQVNTLLHHINNL